MGLVMRTHLFVAAVIFAITMIARPVFAADASTIAAGPEQDSTKRELESAKAARERAVKSARENLIKAMNERIQSLSASGNLDATKAAVQARDAFTANNTIPLAQGFFGRGDDLSCRDLRR